jgi:hypothetical protein
MRTSSKSLLYSRDLSSIGFGSILNMISGLTEIFITKQFDPTGNKRPTKVVE